MDSTESMSYPINLMCFLLFLCLVLAYRVARWYRRRVVVAFVDHRSTNCPVWNEARLYSKLDQRLSSLTDGLLGLRVLGDVVARAARSNRIQRLFGNESPDYYIVVPSPVDRTITTHAWNEPLCRVPITMTLVSDAKRIAQCLNPEKTTVLFVEENGNTIECDCKTWKLKRSPITRNSIFRHVDLLVLASGPHISKIQPILHNCESIGTMLSMTASDQYSYQSDEEFEDAVLSGINIKQMRTAGTLRQRPARTYYFNSGHDSAITFGLCLDQPFLPPVLDRPMQVYDISGGGYANSAKYFPALLYKECYEDFEQHCGQETQYTLKEIRRMTQDPLDNTELGDLMHEFVQYADTISSRHASLFAYAGNLLNWQTNRLFSLGSLWKEPTSDYEDENEEDENEEDENEEDENEEDNISFEHCFQTSRRVNSVRMLNVWDVTLNDAGGELLKERLFPTYRSTETTYD